MFKNSCVKLETVGEREFELLEDLVYEGDTEKFRIPGRTTIGRGFVTDFASVPRLVQWLIPTYGLYTLAAIVHDYFCVQLFLAYKLEQRRKNGINVDISIVPPVSARDADGIFRRMMRELGVPFLRRWVMWTGVRWGALFNPARRAGISRDLFRMICWSIISAPVVVPASVLVGLALLIDKVFEHIIGRFLK